MTLSTFIQQEGQIWAYLQLCSRSRKSTMECPLLKTGKERRTRVDSRDRGNFLEPAYHRLSLLRTHRDQISHDLEPSSWEIREENIRKEKE